MSDEIRHFMWDYQKYYLAGWTVEARNVFGALDDRLEPSAFLVGIHKSGVDAMYRACVEPEDDFWVNSTDFDGALDRAIAARAADPEFDSSASSPPGSWHNERLLKKHLCLAVGSLIREHPNRPSQTTYFVSWPVLIEGHYVMLVLGLSASAVASWPRLRSETTVQRGRVRSLSSSLGDATIAAFFDESARDLCSPNAGAGPRALDAGDILRHGGKTLLDACVYRVDSYVFDISEGLYETMVKLAATPYEKTEAVGRMLLARSEHPAAQSVIEFSPSRPLKGGRSVRKYLQLTAGGLALHTNGKDAFGLVGGHALPSPQEDAFELKVLGRGRWELWHQDTQLMSVTDGEPSLPMVPRYLEELGQALRLVFVGIEESSVEHLVGFVKAAAATGHGGLIVVTRNAQAEAARLKGEAISVKAVRLDSESVGHFTAIDGALLVDPEGVCFGLGVILDGEASNAGDPSRGARFNSAIRYVTSQDKAGNRSLAAIISVDGGVSIYHAGNSRGG